MVSIHLLQADVDTLKDLRAEAIETLAYATLDPANALATLYNLKQMQARLELLDELIEHCIMVDSMPLNP